MIRSFLAVVALLAVGCASAPPKAPAGAPRTVEAPKPEYPLEAQRQRAEGTVKVRYGIAPDGSTRDLRVMQSAHPLLDQAAIDAVSRWRHEPGDWPDTLRLTASIEFNLAAPGMFPARQATRTATPAPSPVAPVPLQARNSESTRTIVAAAADTQPAGSSTPPEPIRLKAGGYPESRALAQDVLGCARVIGLDTIEQLQAFLGLKSYTDTMQAIRHLRGTADYLECMDRRGYVVPLK